jgi:hypothetical protein
MRRFKVILDANGSQDDYPDGSAYRVDDGSLTIHCPNGDQVTYSPVGWVKVVESGDHDHG